MPEPTPVALVTGAARRLGAAIAQQLHAAGYAVVLHCRGSRAEADALAARLEARRAGSTLVLQADLAEFDRLPELVAQAVGRFGRLDALVNNAGLTGPHDGPIDKLDLARWKRRIGVNLTGAFLMAKHAVPHLRRARGAIVNIASTRGLQSEPDTEAYAASKGGLVALTHALALSLGPEVRVNCVSPGWIAHEPVRRKDHAQHPVGRVGQPRDVAELVAYLLSDAAGFVTGQNFVIDGGMTRKMIYV